MGGLSKKRCEISTGKKVVPELLRLFIGDRLPLESDEVAVAERQLRQFGRSLSIDAGKIIRQQFGEQRADTPAVETGVTHRELEFVIAAYMNMETEQRRLAPFKAVMQLGVEPSGDPCLLVFILRKIANIVHRDCRLCALVHNLERILKRKIERSAHDRVPRGHRVYGIAQCRVVETAADAKAVEIDRVAGPCLTVIMKSGLKMREWIGVLGVGGQA